MGLLFDNQSPPFSGINLFTGNAALCEAVSRAGLDAGTLGLPAFGADWGQAARFDLARQANENAPRLHTHDPAGQRLDIVEFHPAWHALMASSMASGLHVSTWQNHSRQNDTHTARAARIFMVYQVESGHVCPITMTHAAVAVLRQEPDIFAAWAPHLLSRHYDPAFRPWWEKAGVTLGMGMTERQGGSDVRANTTEAVSQGDHYRITGHKWFMSAPMCDAFLVLAQARGGLTCFLMPRFCPDGSVNKILFQRLKDKLGNRSNASSEAVFEAAFAQRIGPEGQGVRTIIEMVQLTRFDCAVASAGLMRFGLAYAVHHAGHRSAFGKRLVDQPLMRNVLADMALEAEANTALVFRLARAFDHAADPKQAAYARLMTPAIKYLLCKTSPHFVCEAMECLGGNGYVEELPLARAYREAPVNAIWEGSGNIVALDVLRVHSRARDQTVATIEEIGANAGRNDLAHSIVAGLAAPDAERKMRDLTERLARLAALAALREARQRLAESYAATRFSAEACITWGARDLSDAEGDLIARVLSQEGIHE